MKKKFTCLFLAFVLCFNYTVIAYAATDNTHPSSFSNMTSASERITMAVGDNSTFSVISTQETRTYTLTEYEANLCGVQTNLKEKIFNDGTNVLECYEYESGLFNEVKITPDGKIYLDGLEVTFNTYTTETPSNVTPRAGSMLVDMDEPYPGASYTKYSRTEHTDIALNTSYAMISLAALIAVVSSVPGLGGLAIGVGLVIETYWATMQANYASSNMAYISSAIYTTPTIFNPPYQYFKYNNSYYADAAYTQRCGGIDTTYCVLSPTL